MPVAQSNENLVIEEVIGCLGETQDRVDGHTEQLSQLKEEMLTHLDAQDGWSQNHSHP